MWYSRYHFKNKIKENEVYMNVCECYMFLDVSQISLAAGWFTVFNTSDNIYWHFGWQMHDIGILRRHKEYNNKIY